MCRNCNMYEHVPGYQLPLGVRSSGIRAYDRRLAACTAFSSLHIVTCIIYLALESDCIANFQSRESLALPKFPACCLNRDLSQH